jgi:hypothetical protein
MSLKSFAAKGLLLAAAIPAATAVTHTAYTKFHNAVTPRIAQARQVGQEASGGLMQAVAVLTGGAIEDEKPLEQIILWPTDYQGPEDYYKDLGAGYDIDGYYKDARPEVDP